MVDNDYKISSVFYSGDEALLRLNELLSLFQKLFKSSYEYFYFERLLLVLDSSILLSDVRYSLINNCQTSLQLCLKYNIASIIAPLTLERELIKHASEFSVKEKINEEKLKDSWNMFYKPYINLVETVPSDTTELLTKLRDKNDKSFIQLYESSYADAILTKDKDIEVLKISPDESLKFIVDLRKYAESKSVELQFSVGGLILSTITIAFLEKMIKAFIGIVKKFPILQVVGLGVVLYFLLSPSGQEKLKKTKYAFTGVFNDVISSKEIQHIANSFRSSAEKKELILGALPDRKELKTLRHYVRRVFFATSEPLSIHEIRTKIEIMGYSKQSLSSNYYLRRVLGTLQHIEQVGVDTWKIRQAAIED